MRTRIRIFIILSLVMFFLVGCNSSTATSAKPILSTDQAAQIIITDLKYHGVVAKQVTINRLTITDDKKGAFVEFTILKNDGTSQKNKANLAIEKNGWHIEEHNH